MIESAELYKPNADKAAMRVAINGVMLASLVLVLTIIFLDQAKYSLIVTTQLTLAVPMLFMSCLAYAKTGYKKEVRLWNHLGYVTNIFGNMAFINAVGIMVAPVSTLASLTYFALMVVLLFVYSLINLIYEPKTVAEQIIKFIFPVSLIIAGGILPLLLFVK
ncbi:MAG: hypothetical protein KBC81_01085 [Candidatus Pacebacteria bacterium]|nr:hypothetical protein [Candidatus Paceibacterota bacterium]